MTSITENGQPLIARRQGGSAMRTVAVSLFAVYVAGATVMMVRTMLNPGMQMVAWPVAAIIGIALLTVLVIRWRDPSPAYFEIGVLYAGVVTLYGAYPPIVAMLEHFEFPSTTDGRLYGGQPLPSEIASITWWYAIYLAAFCVTYLLARPRSSERLYPVAQSGRAIIIAAVFLLVVVRLFEMVMVWRFGMHARTYSEEYIVARELPLIWRQFANLANGMEGSLQIILLAALFCSYPRTKWVIWILAMALIAFTVMQSERRSDVAIIVMTCLQLRDLLVRRLTAKAIAIAAIAGFIVYLVMGVVRLEDRRGGLPTMSELTGSYTDFEGIFANAYDLKYLKDANGAFRGHPSMLFADIAAVFPQQMLPFAKTSASKWFITTYYPVDYAQGGGLAFGAVAEGITGYGVPDLIFRGILAGILLGLLHRRFIRGHIGVMFLSFYVWETAMAYQMCRNTTLALLSQTLYRFMPAVVATLLIAAALRRGQALRRGLLAPR